jgi:hypothetical protein
MPLNPFEPFEVWARVCYLKKVVGGEEIYSDPEVKVWTRDNRLGIDRLARTIKSKVGQEFASNMEHGEVGKMRIEAFLGVYEVARYQIPLLPEEGGG